MMFSDQVYRTRLRSLFTELDLLPLNAREFGAESVPLRETDMRKSRDSLKSRSSRC